MNTNTHFVIVWDCDAGDKAETLRGDLSDSAKVTAFSFRRRSENKIARNGIENNYDEEFLRPFAITKSDSDGTQLGHGISEGSQDQIRRPRFAARYHRALHPFPGSSRRDQRAPRVDWQCLPPGEHTTGQQAEATPVAGPLG